MSNSWPGAARRLRQMTRPFSALALVAACAALTCLLAAAPARAALGVVDTFGTEGGAAGQFLSPQDVATDAAGNVYVVEGAGARVSKFTASGTFVRAWGKDVVPGGGTGFEVCTSSCKSGAVGTGAGEFDALRGVTVDGAGNVLVADRGNDRIQQFTAAGGFVKAWGRDVLTTGGTGFEVCTVAASCKQGETGGAAGALDGPFDIAVDGSGNAYVVDDGNHRVQKYTVATGAFQRMWGKNVNTSGGAGAETCAVAAFCQAGEVGTAAGEFDSLRGIAARGSDVHVADSGNDRIQRFTPTGGFVSTWGKDVAAGGGTGFELCTAGCKAGVAGGGRGELDFPQRIDADAANLYAVDGSNERVVQFTLGGAFVRGWGKDVVPGGSTGFEVCTSSCKAGLTGSSAGELSSATGIDAAPSSVYVADQANKRVQRFGEVADPAQPADPSNEFTVGKLKGTKLKITVPGPGEVEVRDAVDKDSGGSSGARTAKKKKKLLKPASATAAGAGTITVKLKLTKPAKKKLKRKGKLKVRSRISFTPTDGTSSTQSPKLKLKPKRKKA